MEAVDNIAQGRVWTGAAAKEIGLVDEIGELQAAIDAAAELAELTDFDVHVEPERSTQEQIIEALTASVSDYLPSRPATLLGRIESAMQAELSGSTASTIPCMPMPFARIAQSCVRRIALFSPYEEP